MGKAASRRRAASTQTCHSSAGVSLLRGRGTVTLTWSTMTPTRATTTRTAGSGYWVKRLVAVRGKVFRSGRLRWLDFRVQWWQRALQVLPEGGREAPVRMGERLRRHQRLSLSPFIMDTHP